MSLLDSHIISNRARAERAALTSSESAGVNPNYISVAVGVKPSDYVPDTGPPFGQYYSGEGIVQKVVWNDDTNTWDDFGPGIADIDYINDKGNIGGDNKQAGKLRRGTTSQIENDAESIDDAELYYDTQEDRAVLGSLKRYLVGFRDVFIKRNSVEDLLGDTPGFWESLFGARPTRNVIGFYPDTEEGGGEFVWNSSEDKANHNGGTIINPDHNSTIGSANWYTAGGDSTDTTGSGCWVRIISDTVTPDMYGANNNNDAVAIQTAIDTHQSIKILNEYSIENDIFLKDHTNLFGNGRINLQSGVAIKALGKQFFSIRDIEIVGAGNDVGNYGIILLQDEGEGSCIRYEISGVYITRVHTGIYTDGGFIVNIFNCDIRRMYEFAYSEAVPHVGIHIDGGNTSINSPFGTSRTAVNAFNIRDNNIEVGLSTDLIDDYGIIFGSRDLTNVETTGHGNFISGNCIEGYMKTAIEVRNMINSAISQNYTEYVYYSVDIQGLTRSLSVIDNTFNNGEGDGNGALINTNINDGRNIVIKNNDTTINPSGVMVKQNNSIPLFVRNYEDIDFEVNNDSVGNKKPGFIQVKNKEYETRHFKISTNSDSYTFLNSDINASGKIKVTRKIKGYHGTEYLYKEYSFLTDGDAPITAPAYITNEKSVGFVGSVYQDDFRQIGIRSDDNITTINWVCEEKIEQLV